MYFGEIMDVVDINSERKSNVYCLFHPNDECVHYLCMSDEVTLMCGIFICAANVFGISSMDDILWQRI